MGFTYDDYPDLNGLDIEEEDHLLEKRMLLLELKKELRHVKKEVIQVQKK